MKRIILVIGFLCTSLFAIDDKHMGQLNDSIDHYLTAVHPKDLEKTISSNKNKTNKKIDQKCQDNPALNEQSALNSILIDWFNDHKKELENKDKFDKSTLETCCLLIKYVFDCNYAFPEEVTKEFTNQDVDEFCDFLNKRSLDKK